jgi:hypothetical protein
MSSRRVRRSLPHNKQLQRTVTRRRVRGACAPRHYALAARFTRQRAAAELRRYAARWSAAHDCEAARSCCVIRGITSLFFGSFRGRGHDLEVWRQ